MNAILRYLASVLLSIAAFDNIVAQETQTWQLSSPDGSQSLTVGIEDSRLYYNVRYNGATVIMRSYLSLTLSDGEIWGRSPKVKKAESEEINETYDTPVWIRSKTRNHCNQLTLTMSRDYSVVFRAYDDGIAYRFVSTRKGNYTILDEEVAVNFASSPTMYVAYSDNAGHEALYTTGSLANWNGSALADNPVVFKMVKAKVCLTESDLKDYPAMLLTKGNGVRGRSVEARFHYAAKSEGWKPENNGMTVVNSRQSYLAACNGTRSFPWRVMIVSADEGTFLSSDMVYALGRAPEGDYSWVKPGQAVWDWWSELPSDGLDFTPGMNTQTWLYRIDFAAKYGIPYVLVDAGWSKDNTMLTGANSNMDLEKIISYGNGKNVGVILWGFGFRFADKAETLAKKYSEMGIKGFKLDFWERTDQQALQAIEKVAKTAAKYKLLVDYHGCWPVAGFSRTYPNVIDFEGVHGGEQFKWNSINVDQMAYDVTFPFARMVAAPVDYTQGAMRNGTKSTFKVSYNYPMSQGTRCHQLAEYVIFFSPVTMWSDHVAAYNAEAECAGFISKIPTVYDETVPLENSIGNYVSVARRKGDEWYVGAITNWTPRSLSLDLGFLGDGNWEAEVMADGSDASTNAQSYTRSTISVPADRKVTVKLAAGGGYAMRIYKK